MRRGLRAPSRVLAVSANTAALGLAIRSWVSRSTAEESKALGVSLGPLEVVPRRPVQIASNVDAGVDRIDHGAEMITKKRGAQLVVVVGHAVLGDQDRKSEVMPKIDERLSKRARVDCPARTREGQVRHRLMPGEEHSGRSRSNDTASLV